MKYKVVKIWFVEADDEDQALDKLKEPVFVSVNNKFKVGEDDINEIEYTETD